ncbi:hypothetical protein ACVJGB_001280 [Bradyrhizobium liaoningense]
MNGCGPSGATWRRTTECTPSADQEVAFDGGAVGKVSDDRLVSAILDLDQALLEIKRDAGAPGLVDQDLVQRGA